jgi:purine-nucleoside phosphorylase
MLDLYDQIEAAAAAIQSNFKETPHAGIILGTGLGGLVEKIDIAAAIDYGDIPNFPKSTATSHRGRLVCGRLEGIPIVCMEGRFHQYEGYPLKKITLPVRVFKRLGAKLMIVSQAVGGLNTMYRAGDVMIIDDQINLMGDNPLVGVNDDRLGPRFPDMSQPFDFELIDAGLEIARKENFVAHRGVSVAVTGPNLETRAEYRFLRRIGADVVGMSTIPETIVAAHCGLRTFGLAVITDMCYPDHAEPVNVEQIIATANTAGPKLRAIVSGVLKHDAAKSRK